MTSVRPPSPTFSKVWYVSMLNVVLASLPLEFLGVEWWPLFAGYWVMFGLGWFGSAEWVASDVRTGFSGTKTSWIFWKIDDSEAPWRALVARVLLGLYIGFAIWWRVPEFWYLDEALSVFFITWLPYHYIKPGFRGPWEKLAAWVAGRF